MKHIFPGAYFGNIAYFIGLINAEEIIIDLGEHFVKQTIRTRCTILGANGPLNLSIPVIRPNGSKTQMKDVLIEYKENWMKNHWKAIESAYASSPYFEAYDREIKEILDKRYKYLRDIQEASSDFIIDQLELPISLAHSETYWEGDAIDHRNDKFDEPTKSYIQVFDHEQSFSGISIIDLLMNEGPMARNYLMNHTKIS
jgi:hypothetical protein